MFINETKWKKIDDLFVNNNVEVQTMFSEETVNMIFSVEDNSWWFQYRANIILDFLNKFFSKKAELVDVGGGNGFMTQYASINGYNAILLEPSYEGCLNAKKRGVKNIYCGELDRDGIINDSISQIMILDVLEHVNDDELLLKTIYSKLSTGAYCLITVPAFMKL